MKSTLQKSADGSIELTITIAWAEIQKTYDIVVDETVANAEIAGFRKGKAPKSMVLENLDKNKVYEETIKRLVPKAYTDAVTEQKLTPIMMPQIDLKSAEEGKDWVVSAKTCEKPEVKLGDYKKAVSTLKTEKAPKIIVPGKEETKEEPKITVDDVLKALETAVTVTIPTILIDHEVNHQLSQLVDQTKKLGLTVEQYLASTGRTADSVRGEYADMAKKNLTLEFALEAIADTEHIAVTDDELQKIIESAKTPEERQSLESQRYYLSSLVRRQKTLDALIG